MYGSRTRCHDRRQLAVPRSAGIAAISSPIWGPPPQYLDQIGEDVGAVHTLVYAVMARCR